MPSICTTMPNSASTQDTNLSGWHELEMISQGETLSTPSKPLRLEHGPLRQLFLLPTSIWYHAVHLRDDFRATLPSVTQGLVQDDEPSSIGELFARFLAHIVRHLEKTSHDDGITKEIIAFMLHHFETDLLRQDEIHSFAAALPGDRQKRLFVIQAYFEAHRVLGKHVQPYEPNLLRATKRGDVQLYAMFGGQGNTDDYISELREAYDTYGHLIVDVLSWGSGHLKDLSQDPRAGKTYSRGLDLMAWLQNPDEQPEADYLITAPVSFPLIGLLQLAQYSLACRLLGTDPRGLRDHFSGSSGHSQGVVVALAISCADSWDSFYEAGKAALTILFWTGLRAQQTYSPTSILPALVQESEQNNEGIPGPMLSVRGLPRNILLDHVNATNNHLPQDKSISICLVNGRRNLVVGGPPTSLCALNSRLRKLKPRKGLDQTRIPFTQRRTAFTNVFLPISVPFHSPYLLPAYDQIIQDLHHVSISKTDIAIPVFATDDGRDLKEAKNTDILAALVRMITCNPVQWEQATAWPERKATHVLDFGPGGNVGVGLITHQNKEGSGLRVISASSMDGKGTDIGSKQELYDRNDKHPVQYHTDWQAQFGPRLIKNTAGDTFVDTKFSRLLGLPPIMVAGMTPCTVYPEFVIATMNAGYHIELAGGGYYDPQTMGEAIRKVASSIVPGRGITVNLIYVSPQAIAWQVPLIKQLRAEGIPIDGLTIGAGIPTPEVANEYITNLGLRHISFKPGSTDAIQQVINIAKSNDGFPVILQWTGGRGGGHHSFEDFHQPILQMYGRIRECENIVLVAGSGFGGADDTYPYLTGVWSTTFGHSPMPFDGVLFGSRMMIAKETRTSKAAKQAIVDAKGSDDTEWELTYKGSSGGVITVLSEMGQPIHKLATRGVLFWAEMDQKIFSIEDRTKRAAEIKKQRGYIIQRLNNDFQKVWFGRKLATGESVDVEEMTFYEVISRMMDLLYVKRQSRWIDSSYRKLLVDFIHRMEERYVSVGTPSIIQNYAELDDPWPIIAKIPEVYPACKRQLVGTQDFEHFLLLCQRRGRKPVPFIPVLDETFEKWFKKDSLWQSEDLDAVVDQDIGRTCILQGPVAARYSKVIDEPIKQIMENVNEAHIARLEQEMYGGDTQIPVIGYFGGKVLSDGKDGHLDGHLDGVTTLLGHDTIKYQVSVGLDGSLPKPDDWFGIIAGNVHSWRHALFTVDYVFQGNKMTESPFKRIFAPAPNVEVEITYPDDPKRMTITLREHSRPVVEVRTANGDDIILNILETRVLTGENVGLHLLFSYHSEAGYGPIREVMGDRNERIRAFYYELQFGSQGDKAALDGALTDTFEGDTFTVDRLAVTDFVNAIGNYGEAYVVRNGNAGKTYAPMDYAFKVAWKAMTKPLFLKAMDGDLSKLVHLSSGFEMLPEASPLKLGDVLESASRVKAILIQDSGKMVEVTGTIKREGKPIMKVKAQYLYRGSYSDYENTFQRKQEVPMTLHMRSAKDVTRLMSRSWFHPRDLSIDLLHKVLTFRLESVIHFKSKDTFSDIETTGTVLFHSSTGENREVGTVEYSAGRSRGNPVIEFLEQHGSPTEKPHMFDNTILLSGQIPLSIAAPASNQLYAQVSGDHNPIHVSRIFANYVALKGNITHGMYISAAVRGLVETWAADHDVERVRRFDCSFVGMVLPNDQIEVRLWHVGMIAGRKIVKVEATVGSEKVLIGEAEVEQPVSAYIFTGQGSQHQGMGMELYAQNQIAREVWDRADAHLMDVFGLSNIPIAYSLDANAVSNIYAGFSILRIVRENPKELTVHFGGPRGRAIREKYMSITVENSGANGEVSLQRIFKEIDENTVSYTHRAPHGLLYSTQFAQPALTLMAKASFAALEARSLIPDGSTFAGHSLGEYAALSALSECMRIEDLITLVFYRGLTMQLSVERDETGGTNYAMCAFNPSRVSPSTLSTLWDFPFKCRF